jgi:hypothetical protein
LRGGHLALGMLVHEAGVGIDADERREGHGGGFRSLGHSGRVRSLAVIVLGKDGSD